MSTLRYRPEVDGLRAIAVLSVILFHLNPNWLPGGFLGVDIFFVISGYLITSIISQEIQENRFSYKNFYNRRIKRIYPVFILVMAIVSVVASFIFIRFESEQLRKTIELATVFSSNFYLSYRQGYFDLSANENPVLHIWSLAVEEQYYLFFPILLAFCYKKFKTHKIFKPLVIGLFIVFVLSSFVPNSWYSAIGLHNTYYISFIRFPELLIGSYLALSSKHTHGKQSQIIASMAFIALFSTFFIYHKEMAFMPGISLILPCVLAALVILHSAQNSWVKTLLSSKPMVWVGKLSYSLYLFHWIFISFTFYITNAKTLPQTAALFILALTFICSALSYYLLEQPIRKSKLTFKQSFFYLYLIPSLIVIGYNVAMKSSIKKKTEALKFQSAEQQITPLQLPSKILTIGDSHADHLQEFLEYVGSKEGWKSDILNVGECILFIDKNGLPKQNMDSECVGYFEKIKSYPTILISAFYDAKRGVTPIPRFNPESYVMPNFDEEFKSLVKYLAKDKQVYVFADNISLNRSALRNVFLAKYGLDKYLSPIEQLGDNKISNQALKELIKDIPNAHWVDPVKYLGDTVYLNDKVIYADQDHLTPFGSYYMGTKFHENERLLSEDDVKKLYP